MGDTDLRESESDGEVACIKLYVAKVHVMSLWATQSDDLKLIVVIFI